MKGLSVKTRILNTFRAINKFQPIERRLASALARKDIFHGFLSKIVPNYYQYPPETLRYATRDGIRYHLDLSDYLAHSIYFSLDVEPKHKLYELVEPAQIIFDIGGNIGETILNFGKRLTTGKVYGFEPVPKTFEKLKKNVSLNQFPSVHIHNIALSDRHETLCFRYPTDHNSGGTVMQKLSDALPDVEHHYVKAMPLDDFVNENDINAIDLIKIDVEGFEYNVLKGAQQTISRFKPKMVIEIDDNLLRKQHTSAYEVLEYLYESGYQLSNMQTQLPIHIQDSVIQPEYFANCHFDVLAVPQNL